MPLLKFKCEPCGETFDELVSLSRASETRCAKCGGRVERAYEGKCLFGQLGSSAGRGSCACGSGGACSGSCGHCTCH